MRGDRVIRPGKRKETVSPRPSNAGAAFPISEFIIPPSDARGRSASISASLPPAMQRLASIIVEKRELPFETQGDVWRWCIHHGLAKLADMIDDKEIIGEWATIQNWVKVESVQLEHLFYEKHLNRIIESVKKLETEGHPTKAIKLAELVWRQSDRIVDSYWCDRYRDTMKRVLDRLRDREDRRVSDRRKERD